MSTVDHQKVFCLHFLENFSHNECLHLIVVRIVFKVAGQSDFSLKILLFIKFFEKMGRTCCFCLRTFITLQGISNAWETTPIQKKNKGTKCCYLCAQLIRNSLQVKSMCQLVISFYFNCIIQYFLSSIRFLATNYHMDR